MKAQKHFLLFIFNAKKHSTVDGATDAATAAPSGKLSRLLFGLDLPLLMWTESQQHAVPW